MAWDKWVKERGTEPPSFSPVDEENHTVVTGMIFIGNKPPRGEPCVGEFWWDENGKIFIEFYRDPLNEPENHV